MIGRRIVARAQKEGLAAALPKVVHKAGHQLHGSALAAVFGAGVHVAEQPHASAFNGHHIGKGIAIAVQQIKEDVKASLGAQHLFVAPAPRRAFVAQKGFDALSPVEIRALHDTGLYGFTGFERDAV